MQSHRLLHNSPYFCQEMEASKQSVKRTVNETPQQNRIEDSTPNKMIHSRIMESRVSTLLNSNLRKGGSEGHLNGSQCEQYQLKVKKFIGQKLSDPTGEFLKQGVVEIQYMTNSVYIGQVQANVGLHDWESSSAAQNSREISPQKRQRQKQGYGVYYFSNGDIYFGEFFNNKFHSHGVYLFSDKSDGSNEYFEGEFSNGQAVKGTYFYHNRTYIGEIRNQKPHGFGKMIFGSEQQIIKKQTLSYFQGSYNEGVEDGEGIFVDVQSQTFVRGKWKEGNLIFGRVNYGRSNQISTVQFYEGEFSREGKFQGQGIYHFDNKCYYEGQFKDGKFHGKGRIVYENGDIFEGNFERGHRWKFGNYFYSSGTVYRGNWQNDKMSGICHIQYRDGNYYKGDIHGGEVSGAGIYTQKFNPIKKESETKIYGANLNSENHLFLEYIGNFEVNSFKSGQVKMNGKGIRFKS